MNTLLESEYRRKPEVVPLWLGDDTVVHVEVSAASGDEDVSALSERLSFRDIADSIRAVASALQGTLRDLKPDKATIEFGIGIGIESGKAVAVLVQGTGSCNVKVTLEWGGRSQP